MHDKPLTPPCRSGCRLGRELSAFLLEKNPICEALPDKLQTRLIHVLLQQSSGARVVETRCFQKREGAQTIL